MLSKAIYEQVVNFIDDKIDLEQLEEWAVNHSEEIAKRIDSDDASFLAAIDLAIAEYSDGIRDLDQVKSYLLESLQETKGIFATLGESMSITYCASNKTSKPSFHPQTSAQFPVTISSYSEL